MMQESMQKFIFEANIANFKKQIRKETDSEKLRTLQHLLSNEEAGLAEYLSEHRKASASSPQPSCDRPTVGPPALYRNAGVP
jgi:hypothetical protein